jgi:hypothetical protein
MKDRVDYDICKYRKLEFTDWLQNSFILIVSNVFQIWGEGFTSFSGQLWFI